MRQIPNDEAPHPGDARERHAMTLPVVAARAAAAMLSLAGLQLALRLPGGQGIEDVLGWTRPEAVLAALEYWRRTLAAGERWHVEAAYVLVDTWLYMPLYAVLLAPLVRALHITLLVDLRWPGAQSHARDRLTERIGQHEVDDSLPGLRGAAGLPRGHPQDGHVIHRAQHLRGQLQGALLPHRCQLVRERGHMALGLRCIGFGVHGGLSEKVVQPVWRRPCPANTMLDLVAERVDLAVRLGPAQDPSLIGQPLVPMPLARRTRAQRA